MIPLEEQKDFGNSLKPGPEFLAMIRATVPARIIEDIVSVQPMDPSLGKQLMEGGMSEEQLIAEGYAPVSHHKLMWVKN